MESIMLTVKLGLFYGLEVFVVAVAGATLIVGVSQLIRSRVRGIGERQVYPSNG